MRVINKPYKSDYAKELLKHLYNYRQLRSRNRNYTPKQYANKFDLDKSLFGYAVSNRINGLNQMMTLLNWIDHYKDIVSFRDYDDWINDRIK